MEDQPSEKNTTSLGDLILNIFASPGEAFEGLRTAPPRTTVWLLPWILSILFASSFAYVMFSNETLREQALEAQRRGIQERVESGSMTAEQAERATEGMERMGGMFIVFGIIGSAVVITIVFFGAALILWLVGKFALQSQAGYGKFLEVYGLTGWIGLLGSVVYLLMVIGLNSIYASPSLALTIFSNYDSTNKLHQALTQINVFGIWQMIAVGIGLGKISEKPVGTGVAYAAGLWLIWSVIVVLIGFAR